MSVVWAEISDEPEAERFQALSTLLNEVGVANEFRSITCTSENFIETAQRAKLQCDQLRIGGDLRELAPSLTENIPSSLLSLKMADALVRIPLPKPLARSNGAPPPTLSFEWWPRCFLAGGLGRAIVACPSRLEITAAAFILGCNATTRAVVAALVALGFRKFTLSDLNDVRAEGLLKEFRASYFENDFRFVPHNQMTQLPSVHSIAVNAMSTQGARGLIESELNDLFFFNFLKPGGRWLDLSLLPNAQLDAEALAVGAVLDNGLSVAVWTDVEWVQQTFAVYLEPKILRARYEAVFGWTQTASHI